MGKGVMSEIKNPIELAIFQSSIHSIAEEMGAALRRTSISPNVRRDGIIPVRCLTANSVWLPWGTTCRFTLARCLAQ